MNIIVALTLFSLFHLLLISFTPIIRSNPPIAFVYFHSVQTYHSRCPQLMKKAKADYIFIIIFMAVVFGVWVKLKNVIGLHLTKLSIVHYMKKQCQKLRNS